jgi:hypothetical protein
VQELHAGLQLAGRQVGVRRQQMGFSNASCSAGTSRTSVIPEDLRASSQASSAESSAMTSA